MTLSNAQKLSGTLPASKGRRFLAPGTLPVRPTGDDGLDDLLNDYVRQVEQMNIEAAAVARWTRIIEDADEGYAQAVYEANVKGQKKPTDPRPKAREALESTQANHDVIEHGVCETSDRIQDMRDDLALRDLARARWDERLQRVADLGDAMEEALNDLAEALYLRTWLGHHKPTRAIEGRRELAALRRQVAKYQDTEPVRRVSPAAMKALENGEDAEDIDGKPLAFADADALFKRGKLAVNHGKPLPRNAPEFD